MSVSIDTDANKGTRVHLEASAEFTIDQHIHFRNTRLTRQKDFLKWSTDLHVAAANFPSRLFVTQIW